MTASTQRARMTALIVEDDVLQSELGAAMLREFDLAIEQVRSAEEAIDHLCHRGCQISLVLADVNLSGGMSGIALAQRVSVLWPGISIIVTSGDPAARESLPAQATYVPKPWRALDIVALAEKASRSDHSVHSLVL